MKFAIPEISWHNRDPVLSVDFQPRTDEKLPLRLATGGTDSHVLIWYLSTTDTGSVNLEVAADLTRHQKAVNVVRWSPNGEMLASGDDESIIFVWKQKMEDPVQSLEMEEQYKESWVIFKTLRGHMEDILDLSWSSDSLHLASGSVDNKLLLWDVTKGRYSCILSDHKGFVQGVSWDPKGQYIVTASSDRTFRTFDVNTKKVTSRSSKAILPFPSTHPLHNVSVRLYHDDTLQTFYRRLHFSPDGLLIAVPAGKVESEQGKEGKPFNAVYIYTRYCLKVPLCVVPCGEPALAVRWAPRALRPRPGAPPAALAAPRLLLAVATRRSVLIYDTHQKTPIALISNIHYTRLTDLTWSQDGLTLVASSTDGFCSVITFAEGELGEQIPLETPQTTVPMEIQAQKPTIEAPKPIEIKRKPEPKPTTEPPKPIEIKRKPTTEAAKPTEVKDKPEPKATTPKTKEKPETKSTTPKSKEKPETKSTTPKTKDKSETKSTTPKIDSFIKFKAPSQKKKQKQPKTPVKIDVHEEVAMPSWSDNSSNEIIRPKDNEMEVDENPDNSEIMIIEDSEDIKLVYEETQGSKSPNMDTSGPKSPANGSNSPDKSPEEPKSLESILTDTMSSASEHSFMKQAKVTDVKETAAAHVVPSPKAPRRVNFVTLSSPKNKKKK